MKNEKSIGLSSIGKKTQSKGKIVIGRVILTCILSNYLPQNKQISLYQNMLRGE